MSDLSKPAIPTVGVKVDADVRRALTAIKDYLLQVYALKSTAFGGEAQSLSDNASGDVSKIVNDAINKIPVDPGTTIPQPASLTAQGLYNTIMLRWSTPASGMYAWLANTEVWWNEVDDLETASLLSVIPYTVSLYLHTAPDTTLSATYYYWVRFVSTANRKGPWNSAAGVSGRTVDDVAYLLDVLRGEISESELATELSSQIAGYGEAISALNAQVADLSSTPPYDEWEPYDAGDMVTYNGKLYKAIAQTTGNLPTNTSYWQLVGEYASLGDAVAAYAVMLSDHDVRISSNSGSITSLSATVTTLGANVAENTAAIQNEATARANADSAEATARTTLAARVTAAEGNIATNAASIQTETTARVNADSALSQSIATLSSTVGDHTTSIQTHASSINGLEGKYTVKIDNNGYVSGFGLASTANNGIPTSEFQVRADRFSITNPNATQATISSLTRSNTTATLTTSTAHNLIAGESFSVRGVENDTNWNASYRVLTKPSSTQITFTVANTLTTPATGTSMKCAKSEIPFIVDDSRVYMDTAMIKTATITSAQIQTLGVDKLVAGGTPENPSYITAALITDGAITNAKIGDLIQSADGTSWSINKNGGIDARNITIKDPDGTVILQSGGNLDYTRVGGTKPPADADKTSENTSAGIANQGSFATLSKITGVNASTYIESAAIGTALIKDAAVETIKIGENAVTVPASAYTIGSITLSSLNTWYTIQSVALDSIGQPVVLISTFNFPSGTYGGASARRYYLRYVLNGSTVLYSSNGSFSGTYDSTGEMYYYGDIIVTTTVSSINNPNGTNTFSLQLYRSSSLYPSVVENRYLTAIGLKR